MTYKQGIIEGFYGKPWSFEARKAYIPFMQSSGYDFFIYAPKADKWLRENWEEAAPEALSAKLSQLGVQLRDAGIDWGVGLSPFELHKNFNADARTKLKHKLSELGSWGCNTLAILFDDMRGDFPSLARTQVDICHFIQDQGGFEHLIMCPSYYSFDPVLERVFGNMPERYWEDLGAWLNDAIDIFWTGELVCSPAYSESHLLEVGELLQRKPFLWDNYPVNDGARMSPFLHLSPFQGREYCNENLLAGIAVNPMNEAYLSQLPLVSLSANLAGGDASQVWRDFVVSQLGSAGLELLADQNLFEKSGLHQIGEAQTQSLIEKYQQLQSEQNCVFIEELCAYLKGEYLFDLKENEVPTQILWQD